MPGGLMHDEWEAELAAIDPAQLEREVTAQNDASARATHDVTYYGTLRANGVGPVTACLLVVVRAATDIV